MLSRRRKQNLDELCSSISISVWLHSFWKEFINKVIFGNCRSFYFWSQCIMAGSKLAVIKHHTLTDFRWIETRLDDLFHHVPLHLIAILYRKNPSLQIFMARCVYLSIYNYLAIYGLSIYLSIYLSSIYLSIYLRNYISVLYLFIFPKYDVCTISKIML